MELYLKKINHWVALAILLICTWIYLGGYFTSFDGGETAFQRGENLLDPVETGLSMYFFAKGLFCSAMLFLFGGFMKEYLYRGR